MSSKLREPPSVVSTRIMKTHRMNAVKAFQLQRRVQLIDYEIHQNYSQISDEIDGVRKHLVKIINVKAGMGVSVARRKLLQELGFRVVPVSGSDYTTVILISPDGKRTCVNVADFYNGAMPSVLQRGNNLKPDNEDIQERNPEIDKRKDFRFRIISPPLRSGSRRNFKNIEDENSDDEPQVLFDPSAVINPNTLKLVRPRAHTAFNATRSNNKNLKESASRRVLRRVKTCPSNIAKRNNPYTTPKRKDSSCESSSSTEDTNDEEDTITNLDRKSYIIHEQNLPAESAPNQKTTREQVAQPHNTSVYSSVNKQFVTRKLSLGCLQRNHNVKFVNDTDSIRKRTKSPQTPSRKLSLDSRKIGINNSTSRISTDYGKSHEKKNSAWVDQGTPTETIDSSKDEAITPPANGLHELTLNQVSRLKSGEVSEQTPEIIQPAGVEAEFPRRVSLFSQSSYLSSEHEQRRDRSFIHLPEEHAVSSFRTQERPNSVISNSTVMSTRTRITSRRASTARSIDAASVDISIRDARTDKSVNQEYTTMQMTIGGRQVKVHVPKFSSDALDTVERARAKTLSVRYRSSPKHAKEMPKHRSKYLQVKPFPS